MAFSDLFLGALCAMLATSLGAALILFFRRIGTFTQSAMLSFAAGVMCFSTAEMLLQAHQKGGDLTTVLGLATGLCAVLIIERTIPHIHLHIKKEKIEKHKKKAALLAGTVSIHNIPEGIAIASAFAGSTQLGWTVASSIAIQDVPEGLLVSAPLASYGLRIKNSLTLGMFSGLIEFAAAIIGYLLLESVSSAVPLALAFSAGAMAYVVFVELLPDAFVKGQERTVAFLFMTGVVVAFGMSSLFGF